MGDSWDEMDNQDEEEMKAQQQKFASRTFSRGRGSYDKPRQQSRGHHDGYNNGSENNDWRRERGNNDGGYNNSNSGRYNNGYGQSGDRNGRSDTNRQPYNNRADQSSIDISVDSNIVGRIIGKGGSKIRELESETGAKIKVNKDDGPSSTVTLTGESKAVQLAKEMIEELTQEKPRYQQKQYSSYDRNSEAAPIDWDKLNKQADIASAERWAKCPPMKKNFYFEDPEIAGMNPKLVEELRKGMNNIVVKNVFKEEHIPNLVTTFEQAFLNYPDIMREIQKQGFKTPSPIQAQGWPVLLSGRDLIGIAQTGTGKTLAFLLPALIHIDGQPIPRSERGGANVLVIAPTRELAIQIEEEVNKYTYRGIKSVCVYGGANRRAQMDVVQSGVEIIIATPGRLNDLVNAGVVDVSAVTYLVLDEADRMLDMGFEPQIRKVLLDIRPDRQSVMTSATWPPGVRALAERYMKNPVQVFVGSLDLAAVHSVTQTILIIGEEEKRDYLMDFLQNLTPEDKVMVFVGRKTTADDISAELALAGVESQCIHGDRDQSDREAALRELKSGEVRILVATDVASRGIDITDITKVFNLDFPRNIEEYVHRVGRTGRAGRTGEAITLFCRKDWAFASELIDILNEANQLVPEELFQMKKRFEQMKERREAEGGSSGFRGGRGGGGGRRDRW